MRAPAQDETKAPAVHLHRLDRGKIKSKQYKDNENYLRRKELQRAQQNRG